VGVSGGARQLIVPSIEKQYIVQNDLTDAVTIRTSAGTGVAIPAGKTTVVFNNGTDVVEEITNLNSLTVANLTASAFSAPINASSINTGTLANARTTANSANGASTIVVRDADGSFAGNAVTATSVTATSVTATSVTVTSLSTANFTIQQFGTVLAIQYNGTNVAVINSSGNVSANGQVTAGASI
jgi:hypothetical protein